MLISTHDIHRVKDIADRVGIMKRGRLVVEKASRDIGTASLQEIHIRCMTGEDA